jgi:DNA modification methylase
MSKIDLAQQIAAVQVTPRPVADLLPYARNSKKHSKEQVAMIAGSMKEFGFTAPVLIAGDPDPLDGKVTWTILAGHGRVEALNLLGQKLCPTIDLSHLSPIQRQAYVIADNRLAEKGASWDDEVLKLEAMDLHLAGFDMEVVGFDDEDLKKLLGDLEGDEETEGGLTDEDAVPEAFAHAVTEPGDVWILGDHRIICGSSTDPNITAGVGADEASVTVSDPPYGIGYEYESHDDSDNAANAQLVWDAFTNGPDCRVWTPGLPNLARDIARFPGKTKVAVWSKKFAAAGNGVGGASTWEPILINGKPPERKLKNDVIEIMTERLEVEGVSLRKLHSCPKPVALYALLIEAFVPEKGIVFEPFSGSGTTIMACEKTGRACRAVELEPKYVDVAVRRWQENTGRKAILAGTRKTFEEVSIERPIRSVPETLPALVEA